jgi:hypothetical protein
MFECAIRPEYPRDTPDRSLALHLHYLVSDPDNLSPDGMRESDEKLFVLRPFVFAAHQVSVGN